MARRVSILSTLAVLSGVLLCGCNPPNASIPRLKPRTASGMTGSGLTGSGITGSGLTSSGITWANGITLSGGITMSGGITLPGSGITTAGSGTYPRLGSLPTPRSGISLGSRSPQSGTETSSSGDSSDGDSGAEKKSSDNEVTSDSDPADEDQVKVKLASFEDVEKALADAKGKIVVLDVWSTSCIPCMREFPNLVELSKQHPENLVCISLNVDYIGLKKKAPASYLPKVKKFLEKQDAKLMNLVSSEPDEEMREKLGINSIPAILVYDASGDLAQRFGEDNAGDDGLTYKGDVLPKVAELLED